MVRVRNLLACAGVLLLLLTSCGTAELRRDQASRLAEICLSYGERRHADALDRAYIAEQAPQERFANILDAPRNGRWSSGAESIREGCRVRRLGETDEDRGLPEGFDPTSVAEFFSELTAGRENGSS